MSSLKEVFFILCITLISSCNFAPGTYPYAEEYELSCSEDKAKAAINKFKQENPNYIVPKVTIKNQGAWDLADGQSKEPAHWYGVYFYYRQENQIIYAWTRPINKDKTTFAFVSVNNSLDLGHWKDINKDFSEEENNRQKHLFEERILNKIKVELQLMK